MKIKILLNLNLKNLHFPALKVNFFLLIFSFLGICMAFAQPVRQRGDDGEIEDAEIIIDKERKIVLPEAQRNYEKVTIPLKPAVKVKQKYGYRDFALELPPLDPKLRVQTMKPDPLDKLYQNYARLGGGNLGTSYLDFYHNSKRVKDYAYGLNVNHFASAKGPVASSGWSNNTLGGYAKYFTSKYVLEGALNWNRQRYNFFGFDDKIISREKWQADTNKQIFNILSFNAKLNNLNEKAKFRYVTSLDFSSFRDKFKASESDFSGNLNAAYVLKSGNFIKLDADLALTKITDAYSLSRNLIQIKPNYNHTFGLLKATAGFNFALENDPDDIQQFSLSNGTPKPKNKVHLYPHLVLAYPVHEEKLRLQLGLTGQMEKRTLRSFANQNPFLEPNVTLRHLNQALKVFLHADGKWASKLSYDLGISYQKLENMSLFLNNFMRNDAGSRFLIAYDTANTSLIELQGGLAYDNQKNAKFGIQATYQNYDFAAFDAPYHIPTLRTNIYSRLLVLQKFVIQPEFVFYNGMKGLNSQGKEESIKAFPDLNLLLEYAFSKRVSCFIQGRNLLNQKTPRFLLYPTRGILVMGGFSASF